MSEEQQYLEVYSYHPETGEYLGLEKADKDPVDENRFLIPAHAVTTKPPEVKDNEKQVWTEHGWKVVPDYRGTVVEAKDDSGRKMVIGHLAATPDDVVFEELPEPSYQEKRAMAYPAVTDQLDEIMKWLFTETEFEVPAKLKSIAAQCMAVKSKYPKDKNAD